MRYAALTILTILSCAGQASDIKKVSAPCQFQATLSSTDVVCPGGASGTASVQVTGLTSPFVIEWFNGSNSSAISGLSAGTYFVKITDNTGCFINEFVTVEEPEEFETAIKKTDITCFGFSDGSADLTVSGGTTFASGNPYQYRWTPTSQVTEDLNSARAGWHFVTIRDKNNCTATDSIFLSEPTELKYTWQTEAVKCYGNEDGQINLTVYGGTPVYDYAWSGGDTLEDLYNKPAGQYSVTVTDLNGCTFTEDITIPSPDLISTEFDVTDATCYGFSDGKIDLTVFGGTFPYRFTWSDRNIVLGARTEDIDSIPVGTYTVMILDTNNCFHIDSVDVNESIVLVTYTEITDANCYDSSNASIDLSVTGGTEPYAYLWSNLSTTEDLVNIRAGEYSVTVADAKGCIATASATAGQPDDLHFGMNVIEVSCKDHDDGSIALSPSGASPPYSFSWSNGAVSEDIYDLTGQTYSVTVTDSHGCPFSASATVPVNPRKCITELTIPTAFSPNSDGYNDTWVIRNYEIYPHIKVKVINRWGDTVFSSEGYMEAWDGTKNGRQVPSSTYYYIVDLGNGDPPFSGAVTIIR